MAAVIGRGIKAHRKAQGLTQKALAELCHVSPVTAWRWEAGRQMPRQEHIGAICVALDIEPADLLKEPK